MRTALVGIAGAAGAIVRYRIGLAVGMRPFPWATLAINVTGCFLLALLLTTAKPSTTVATALGVGFLGAYTTFSTFGYETFALLRSGRVGAAAAYVTASFAVGLAATALGWLVGRAVL